MKKIVFCIVPLMMVLMGCASSGRTAVAGTAVTETAVTKTAVAETNGSSAGMDLDAAIREAAAQMGENLPGGTKVALVSVASSSAQFSEYVISRLEAALVSGKKLVVVDRANLDKIREEQGFQASGEVDDDSAKSIGKLLGAGAIVTGAFANLGDVYSLTLKAINIETATVAVSYPADIAKSARIETLLASGGGTRAGTRTTQTGGSAASATQTATPAPVAQTPAATPATTYKVGDAGPAGGIVFYDQGFVMDGWRYLEAAPQDFPTKVQWGSNTSALRTEVGTGKQNTTILVSALNRNGETLRAAQVVNAPKYGGYDDWFLPSKDELNLMYQNLQKRGIGEFSNESYWSSSYDNGMYNGPYYMNFSNGREGSNWYVNGVFSLLVRGIRRF